MAQCLATSLRDPGHERRAAMLDAPCMAALLGLILPTDTASTGVVALIGRVSLLELQLEAGSCIIADLHDNATW